MFKVRANERTRLVQTREKELAHFSECSRGSANAKLFDSECSRSSTKVKVIIIGSGLGGLSCGVILAKNGFDVMVLEQDAQIGGCLQCFSRDGVKFETGMHFVGSAAKGQTLYKLMRYLELTDVRLSPLEGEGYDVVALYGKRYKFAVGRNAFINQMAEYFPHQRRNI